MLDFSLGFSCQAIWENSASRVFDNKSLRRIRYEICMGTIEHVGHIIIS